MYTEYDDYDEYYYYTIDEKYQSQEEEVKIAMTNSLCCPSINGSNTELVRMPIMKFYEKERPSWQSIARSILTPGFLNQNRTVLKYKLTQKPIESTSPLRMRHNRSSSKHIPLKKVQQFLRADSSVESILSKGLATPSKSITFERKKSFSENISLFNTVFPQPKIDKKKKKIIKKTRALSQGLIRSEEFDTIFLRNTDIVIPCKKINRFANQPPGERKRRKSCFCTKCGGCTTLEKKIRDALPENPIKHYIKNPLTRRQNQFARTVLSVQGSLNMIMQFKRIRKLKLQKENSSKKIYLRRNVKKTKNPTVIETSNKQNKISPKKIDITIDQDSASAKKQSYKKASTVRDIPDMLMAMSTSKSVSLKKEISKVETELGSSATLNNSKALLDSAGLKKHGSLVEPLTPIPYEDANLSKKLEVKMGRRSSQKILNISNLLTKFSQEERDNDGLEKKLNELMIPKTATLPKGKSLLDSSKNTPRKSESSVLKLSDHRDRNIPLKKRKEPRRSSLIIEQKPKSSLKDMIGSDFLFIRPHNLFPHQYDGVKDALSKGEGHNVNETAPKMRIIKMKSLELDAFKDELKSDDEENSPSGAIRRSSKKKESEISQVKESLKGSEGKNTRELTINLKTEENTEEFILREKMAAQEELQKMQKALAKNIIQHKRLGFNKSVEFYLTNKNNPDKTNIQTLTEPSKKPTPFTHSSSKSSKITDDIFFPIATYESEENSSSKPHQSFFSISRKNLSRIYKNKLDEMFTKKDKTLVNLTPSSTVNKFPSIGQSLVTPSPKGLNKELISLYLPKDSSTFAKLNKHSASHGSLPFISNQGKLLEAEKSKILNLKAEIKQSKK